MTGCWSRVLWFNDQVRAPASPACGSGSQRAAAERTKWVKQLTLRQNISSLRVVHKSRQKLQSSRRRGGRQRAYPTPAMQPGGGRTFIVIIFSLIPQRAAAGSAQGGGPWSRMTDSRALMGFSRSQFHGSALVSLRSNIRRRKYHEENGHEEVPGFLGLAGGFYGVSI
jgi:hypothetical protein